MKSIRFGVRLFLGILLVYAASRTRTPPVVFARPWDAIGVLTLSLLCIVCEVILLFGRKERSRVLFHALLIGIFAASFGVTLSKEFTFEKAREIVVQTKPETLWPVGQHFLVGYRNSEEVKLLVQTGAIGGLFINRRNVDGKTPAQIHEEIQSLQAVQRAHGRPPLLIATDQEGGIVSRLSPPLPTQPSLATVIADEKNVGSIEEEVIVYATKQAKSLASLGVNVNFAPIVDLDFGTLDPSDTYSQITARAISPDPSVVTRVALLYARTLLSHNVLPTLKHFPGLGRVAGDTHVRRAQLTASQEELAQADWVPFRHILASTSALLMVGHAEASTIDAGIPSSVSKKLLTGIVRNSWQHEGVIITDDFSMMPIFERNGGSGQAAIDAFNAGADIVLIAYDPDLYYPTMAAVLHAIQEKRLDRDVFEKSNRRLSTLYRSLPYEQVPSE